MDTEIVEDDGDLQSKVNSLSDLVNDLIKRVDAIEGSSSDLSKQNEELKKQNEKFSSQIGEFEKKLENTKGAEPIKKKVEESAFNYSNKRLQVMKNFNG